jgi:hypothetical protein
VHHLVHQHRLQRRDRVLGQREVIRRSVIRLAVRPILGSQAPSRRGTTS